MRPKATRAATKAPVEVPTGTRVQETVQQPTVVGAPTQIIYADRILNMGIGGSVSRLTLAIEVGENTFNPFAQLVIPTPNLLEALTSMSHAIDDNDEMRKVIVDGLDALKKKLTKQTP
jgi:hypothetical protein